MDILEYFELSNNGNATGPVAYAPSGASSDIATLVEDLHIVQQLPFSFTLYEVSVLDRLVKGDITDAHDDFQSNNLGLPLISERMKQLIETELLGTEKIKWIEARVKGKSKVFIYYIPCFYQKQETLDIDRTIFIPNTDLIVKPYYDKELVSQYAVFHGYGPRWQMPVRVYVNSCIKHKLVESEITGLIFIKARVD
jgi:hypothetical protein